MLKVCGGNGKLARQLLSSGFINVRSYDPFYDTDRPPVGRYDVVLAFEVMEHVPDPHEVFGAVATFLRESGLFLFSTLLQPEEIDKEGVNWWYVAPRNGHVALHTSASLRIAADRHGLKFGSFNRQLHFAFREMPDFATHFVKT